MGHDGFGDLVLNPMHRVQGIHGGLENHGDPAPSDLPHPGIAGGHEVLAFETDLSGDDRRIGRQKSHEGHADGGLSAPGFAHQPE